MTTQDTKMKTKSKLNDDCIKHICRYLPLYDALRFVNGTDDVVNREDVLQSYFKFNWDLFLQIIESNNPSEVVDSHLQTFLHYNSSTLFEEIIGEEEIPTREGFPSRESNLEKWEVRFSLFGDRVDAMIETLFTEKISSFGLPYYQLCGYSDKHIRAINDEVVYGQTKQDMIDYVNLCYHAGDEGFNIFFTSDKSRWEHIDILLLNPILSIEREIDSIAWAWINRVEESSVSVFWSNPLSEFGKRGEIVPLSHSIICFGTDKMVERAVNHPTFDPCLRYAYEIDGETMYTTITMILAMMSEPEITSRLKFFLEYAIPLHPWIRLDASFALMFCLKYLIKLALKEDKEWGEADYIARISALTSVGANGFLLEHGYHDDESFYWIDLRHLPTSYDLVTNALDDGIIPPHLVPAFRRIKEYHLLLAWPLHWQRGIESFMITNY